MSFLQCLKTNCLGEKMDCSINQIMRDKIDTRIYKDSLCLIPYAVFSLLVLLSTVHFVFSIVNFGLCVAYIVLNKKNKTIPFLIYITYFASIFKILEISEISLYTLLLLLFVVKEAINGRFEIKFLVALGIFAVFIIAIQLISGPINISRNIKFFEFFFYVYIVLDAYFDSDCKLDCSCILKAVIFGVILSSTFRFLDSSVFPIYRFVNEKVSILDAGVFTRFSGLLSDPNYYAVNVHIAIVSTLFLGTKKKITYVSMLCLIVVLFGLAILTGSKSAILMLVFPFVLLLYINFKQKKAIINVFILLGSIAFILLAMLVKTSAFTLIVARFSSDAFSLDSLTTGRTAIWRDYFAYFEEDSLKLIFGSGISTDPLHGKAAHNTYFDVLYYLGLVPGAIFIYLIARYFILKKVEIKRSVMNFSGIIIVLTMYMFLSSLFDIDLGTNLLVAIILFDTRLNDEKVDNVDSKRIEEKANIYIEKNDPCIGLESKNFDKQKFSNYSIPTDLAKKNKYIEYEY